MNVKVYQGLETKKTFRVTIIGTPKAGKSSLLYYFSRLGDAMASYPSYLGLVEVPVAIQTSSGTCNCVFADHNLADYSRITQQQLDAICASDAMIAVCECTEASVQQAVQLLRTFQSRCPFLIANKSDEYDPDMITQAKLNGYASQVGAMALMVSVQQRLNLEHLQFIVADMLMNPHQKYGQICERQAVKQVHGQAKLQKESKCKGQ